LVRLSCVVYSKIVNFSSYYNYLHYHAALFSGALILRLITLYLLLCFCQPRQFTRLYFLDSDRWLSRRFPTLQLASVGCTTSPLSFLSPSFCSLSHHEVKFLSMDSVVQSIAGALLSANSGCYF